MLAGVPSLLPCVGYFMLWAVQAVLGVVVDVVRLLLCVGFDADRSTVLSPPRRFTISINHHHGDQGKLDEAAGLYRRAIAIEEKVYGPDHAKVAATVNNWALLLKDQVGDYSIRAGVVLSSLEADRVRRGAT